MSRHEDGALMGAFCKGRIDRTVKKVLAHSNGNESETLHQRDQEIGEIDIV